MRGLTFHELDAMPVGAVVVDNENSDWKRVSSNSRMWQCQDPDDDTVLDSDELVTAWTVHRKLGDGLTAEQLGALPVGTVVVGLDARDVEWASRMEPDGRWRFINTTGGGKPVTSYVLAADLAAIRVRETHVEQPMPTASTGPAMHDLAELVISERKTIGLERYGQPLQAMNGRDAVRDTIEELADGLVYALQIREERRLLRIDLDRVLDDMDDRDPVSQDRLRDIITRYFPKESA